MKTPKLINALLLFIFLITAQVVFAQTTPPAPAPPPPGFPIPGIILATMAAIGYGSYKTTQNTNLKE